MNPSRVINESQETQVAYKWSPFMTNELKRLWAIESYTIPQIARMMGVSPAAVRNKAGRLRLSQRADQVPPPVAVVPVPVLVVRPAPKLPPATPSLVPRPRDCQWPMWGHERPSPSNPPRFCAKALDAEGGSYCPQHRKVAFTVRRTLD